MSEVDWAAICDILAAEYGWTLDDIKNLSLDKINLLITAIKNRRKAEAEAIRGSSKFPNVAGVPKQSSSVLDMASKLGGKIKKDKKGKIKEIVI